jgi:ElaB/YqjD/DUF883 family membrane-anchored ribosome-binding protein
MATEINPQNRELSESVAAVREGVKNFIDKGSERAADLKNSAMDRGRDAFSTIQRTIEERPFAVIGGVFVGGLLIGMWMRR